MTTTNLLISDLNWLKEVLFVTLTTYVENPHNFNGISLPEAPEILAKNDQYAQFVLKEKLNDEERLLLCISLSRYVSDSWKPLCVERNAFGIYMENDFAYPTCNTFLAILCGQNIEKRIGLWELFKSDHVFFRKGVLDFEQKDAFADEFASKIKVTRNFLELFVLNKFQKPRYSLEFPAEEITTSLDWDNLILEDFPMKKMQEIVDWMGHHEKMREVFFNSGHLKPGYRCLFYGPSGTGKTLAASLLGKRFGVPVFRIDLSNLVSKYIGETSKNLKRLFDMAEDKNWILFFDEGDALFGKRVDTSQTDNKNSTYANQDIAFLLQRIERFNGLILVATNLRNNMDAAFSRRFENIIHFNIPSADRAMEVWNSYLPNAINVKNSESLKAVIAENRMSLASIYNVIHRLSLISIARNKNTFNLSEITKLMAEEKMK